MGIQIAIEGTSVRLRSDRNTAIARSMSGRSIQEAAQILPLLLALCPLAQRAGLLAAAQALRSGEPTETIDERVALEAGLETLRYFSMDLRAALQAERADPEFLHTLGAIRNALAAEGAASSTDALRKQTRDIARRTLEQDSPIAETALKQLAAMPAVDLPGTLLLDAEELAAPAASNRLFEALCEDERFALAPTLEGTRIVGALSEHKPKEPSWRVGDLLKVRLLELEMLATGQPVRFGRIRTRLLAPRCAIALTQTARGPLVSLLRLAAEDRIDSYSTIAPTEWAFQPEGIVKDLLAKLLNREPTLREEDLRLVASAFDPCTDIVFRSDCHA